jgi:hypothetical protein
MIIRNLVVSATLLIASSTCAADTAVSLRRDIVPLFAKECAMCHSKDAAISGLVLEGRFAYQMIVDVPSIQSSLKRVVPGKPELSYLLLKMQNQHRTVGGTGRKMPPGWLEVIPAEVELVKAWIIAGAPDN